MNIHISMIKGEARGFEFVRFKREENVVFLLKVNMVIKVGGRRIFLLEPGNRVELVLVM